VVLSPERLRAEGQSLAGRAVVRVVPTEAAQTAADSACSDGIVAAVAVPVLDAQGQLQAILYGGDLLNRRYEMVDAIRRQVFQDQTYNDKPIGVVTIFLKDLRISTNLTAEDGQRAVGTLLSIPVRQKVLDGGGTWSAAAYAVTGWHFTAYEPIKDPGGHIIGVLSVGLLQAPFMHRCNVVSVVFLAFIIGTTLISLVLLVLVTESAIGPIHHVVTMAQRVIGGDLSARVGIRPAGDMGVLCRAVDSMAHSIQEREEMLQQVTRQQIGRSEQLASVGRLAAGVAHEINNPLTGVLAFADLLREKENMDAQDREDLDLIVRETKRAREIVRGLLDFARETPSRKAPLDVNELVRRTMQLLGKREAFQNINLVEDLADGLPLIPGDTNQLQQVFVNLSLNACEAMPGGGTLLISTSSAEGNVVIEIADTGTGIKREHVDKIFEPFFTTKPVGKGTGLGLSVSYGIVQQHGGTLEVESQERMGTTFTVTLPITPKAGD
jgi:two-component system NtrC family sensor kinase